MTVMQGEIVHNLILNNSGAKDCKRTVLKRKKGTGKIIRRDEDRYCRIVNSFADTLVNTLSTASKQLWSITAYSVSQ